ncbi:MAG: hypothetical protein IPN46_14035 [Saprospiraceae bacterium]|nr:hypothetical protein [Saprospiraceae bacterium]
MSVLTIKFGQNTLAEVNEFQLVVDNKDELKGLSDDLIAAAADAAKEAKNGRKMVVFRCKTSVMPFLQYAESRTLRKKSGTPCKTKATMPIKMIITISQKK